MSEELKSLDIATLNFVKFKLDQQRKFFKVNVEEGDQIAIGFTRACEFFIGMMDVQIEKNIRKYYGD